MKFKLFLLINYCVWCLCGAEKVSEITKVTKKLLKITQKSDHNDLSDRSTPAASTTTSETSKFGVAFSNSPPPPRPTLDFLQESFDFNPNDFEDLHENFKKGNLSYDEDDGDVIDRGADKIDKPSSTTINDDTTKHILKIAAKSSSSSSQKLRKSIKVPNNEHDVYKLGSEVKLRTEYYIDQFELMKKLFDHNLWDADSIMRNHNISLACRRNVKIYLAELHTFQEWALKASDSSGHYSGQIIFGNEYWLGSQYFCVEINRENIFRPFELEFSVISLETKFHRFLKEGKTLTIGQCLPMACCTSDIRMLLKLDRSYQYLSKHLDNTTTTGQRHRVNGVDEFQIKLKILSVRKVPGSFNVFYEKKFYILSFIFISLAIIMFSATYYENRLNKAKDNAPLKFNAKYDKSKHGVCIIGIELNKMTNNNNSFDGHHNGKNGGDHHVEEKSTADNRFTGTLLNIFLCFSIDSNAKRILSVEPLSKDSLTCVHGIRTLSLLWTIMVHTYLQLYLIGKNKFTRKLAEQTFGYQVIGNASYSVDTFFFLSGLLVTLLFLRKLKNPTQSDKCATNLKYFRETFRKVLVFVGYRFIRLTPVYFFVIVLTNVSFKTTFNSSVFSPGVLDHVTCEKYWWRNILYINNWYPFKEFCMIWSWYLANDMQFYFLATTLLLFSVKFFKPIVSMLLTILVSSWFVTAFMSFKHNYTHKVGDPFESFDFLYDKPWQRIGPYIMGMITGYIYFKYKKPKISLQTNLGLWGASLGILFALVFGVYKGELSVVMTAFYVSLGHTAWGGALIWITLSCCWGLAQRVNGVLSYPVFYPLSRLTYCTYLIHPVIQILTSHFMTGSLHLQHTLVLTMFLGNAIISFIIAFVLSLALEAPFVRMLKLIPNK